jgi:UTP-glucose-1-phosphate uridylyltransferase
MDAVILAAGRGQRMLGHSMPFFKPLLEVNGITLLAYAAEYAAAAGAEKTVVVVSPHNITQVKKVLEPYSSWIQIVVQDEPWGPGHAALVGINALADSKRVMLLMSDNIMDQEKVVDMAVTTEISNSNAVGTRTVPRTQAKRFTRVRERWSDGVSRDAMYEFVEGIDLDDNDFIDPTAQMPAAKVWCGPVVMDTQRARLTLSREWDSRGQIAGELKIGPYLTEILRHPTYLFDVNAMDVGVPAAFEAAVEGAR